LILQKLDRAHSLSPTDLLQLEEIFWLTSSTSEFSSEAHRARFANRYLYHYLDSSVSCNWIVKDQEQICGYILCSRDSSSREMLELHPLLRHFLPLLQRFPAHLHINVHPKAQSRGFGGLLLNQLCADLRQHQVPGVHLLTGSQARNRTFYENKGFQPQMIHETVIFLGKVLT
jgi:ribosomal protein S18 acetylase RimI-like enzyme